MFKCHVCGGASARSEFVSEVFTLEGERRALVEHIPAQVHEAFAKTNVPITLSKSPEEFQVFVRAERGFTHSPVHSFTSVIGGFTGFDQSGPPARSSSVARNPETTRAKRS